MNTKQLLKNAAVAIVAALVAVPAQADDYFRHGGIRYKIESFIDQELRVTYPEEADYSTTNLVIPATIRTKQGQTWTVTAIGENAFNSGLYKAGYKNIRSVSIPKTVKFIHQDAFKESNVEEITANCPIKIPFGPIEKKLKLIKLGAHATIGTCEGITSTFYDFKANSWHHFDVTLDAANRNLVMVDGALYDRGKTILLYYSTAKSGAYVMPPTVKKIADCVFHSHKLLTSVTMSRLVTEITARQFLQCKNLQSVKNLGAIKEIGESAFSQCSSLKEIKFSEGLQKIGRDAFGGCAFEYLTLPSTVAEIGMQAFVNNTNLKSLVLPENIRFVEGLDFVSNCPNLESVNIPKSLQVTEMFDGCFRNCQKLRKIVIPSSVESMRYSTFENCKMLEHIYYYPKAPTRLWRSFDNTPKFTLHVLKGYKETFEQSAWSSFAETIVDDL